MDFNTQLPLSNNFDSVLVVVNRFPKMAIFNPTYGTITALELAQIFIRHVFSKHGVPVSIVSDRGSLFASSFWTKLCQQLNISGDLSAAFNPEPDGQTERISTKLKSVQKGINEELESEIRRFKKYAGRNRSIPPDFHPGDKVWLTSKNIKKLSERWLGPFEVIKKIGSHAYHLKLPLQWKSVHPVFHVSLLEPAKQSGISNHNQLPPPPALADEQEEWEVAQVLDSKLKRGKLWYLLEWKGFSENPERTTWEPASNLTNSPELVKDFHPLYPDKPGPITSRVWFYGSWWGEEVMKVSCSPGMHL
ncbi:hypothetical protein O181_038416 [Austropuccinia psidii MF-1]|uniref:Chromo domain-containing protein n=1 Tax=Austropuccinia psidii MF-1 TaxID=1389203 RepID=A0A9Q3HBM2_9BASI|nr:hypothetical protein [Austropuccinia psidii MF-1]